MQQPTTTTATVVVIRLVDTRQGAVEAAAILGDARLLALDMEGDRLGRNGRTSLLQLAASKELVYIFDIIALGASLFADDALGSILKDPAIIKLCYDCRCDAEALFCLHGILANGLYDLQIAYTLLFQSPADPYLKGLHKALAAPGVLLAATATAAAEREQAIAIIINKKLEIKRKCDFGAIMMERPLPPLVLDYCATDVVHLFSMYHLWHERLGFKLLLSMTRRRMLQFIHRQGPSWCMSRLDFALRSRAAAAAAAIC